MTDELKFRAFIGTGEYHFTIKSLIMYSGNDIIDAHMAELRDWLRQGMQPDRPTGVKSNKGEEIFEHDIVEKKMWNGRRLNNVGTFKPFEVKWLDTHFNVMPGKHKYEILGNIHLNPELLEIT